MSDDAIKLTQAMDAIRQMVDADRIVWFDGQEYINHDDVAWLLATYMPGQP